MEVPPTLAKEGPLDETKWDWKLHKAWEYTKSSLFSYGIPSGGGERFFILDGTLYASYAGTKLWTWSGKAWYQIPSFQGGGSFTNVIEDSNHKLWASAEGSSSIQYKKHGEFTWHEEGNDCKAVGSQRAILFEDSTNTLWAGGDKTGLQYKKPNEKDATWHPAGPGSKITDGVSGDMMEDSDGILWVMAKGSPLQYKKPNDPKWYDAGQGNKITDGELGKIIEDKNHTLWAMGNGTSLQYKKHGENLWHDAGNGCTVNNGHGGFLFEDSYGNLWAGGEDSVINFKGHGEGTWENWGTAKSSTPAGALPSAKSNYGSSIYEDTSRTIWYSSGSEPLFCLKLGKDAASISELNPWFHPAFKDVGAGRAMKFVQFTEDYNWENLWVSDGNPTGALFLIQGPVANYWTQTYEGIEMPEIEVKQNTKPTQTIDPRIKFELPKDNDLSNMMGNIKVDGEMYYRAEKPSTKGVTTIDPTYRGATDGKLVIPPNFVDAHSTLKISKDAGKTWEDATSTSMGGFAEDTSCQLKWVAKDKVQYVGKDKKEILIGTFNFGKSDKIKIPTIVPTFTPHPPSLKGGQDGTIEVKGFKDKDSKLQYKLSTGPSWTDVPPTGVIDKLSVGTYQFQWVGINNGEKYSDGSSFQPVSKNAIVSDSIFVNIPSNIIITPHDATYKGATDGRITISNIIDPNSKLKMSSDGGATWVDIIADPKDSSKGLISGLAKDASYKFKWVVNKGLQYKDNKGTEKEISGTFTISEDNKIKTPSVVPTFTPHSPSLKGGQDGTIEVKHFNNTYSKLQYKLSTDPSWTDVPSTGLIEKLAAGTYQFQWVGKQGEACIGGGNAKPLAGKVVVDKSKFVNPPAGIKITLFETTYKGGQDGRITISNITDVNSKLKMSSDNGVTWNFVTEASIEGLSKGDSYMFKWVTNAGLQYVGSKSTIKVIPGIFTISDGTKIKAPSITPTFSQTPPTLKGASDGSIKVTGFNDKYSTLEYKSPKDSGWTPVPTSRMIVKLSAGDYQFRWVGRHSETYTNGKNEEALKDVRVKESTYINIPMEPDISISPLSAVGKMDGEIHIKPYTEPYSVLQYKLDGEHETAWKNIDSNSGLIKTGLGETIFNFRWAPIKQGDIYFGTDKATSPLGDRAIDASKLIDIPRNPKLTPIDPTTIVSEDGAIKVENFKDPLNKSILEYSIDNGPFNEVIGNIENLAPGASVEFKWVLTDANENFTNGSGESRAGTIEIGESKSVPLPTITPKIVGNNVSADGASDGSIDITGFQDLYSNFKYRKVTPSNSNEWVIVPKSGKIPNIPMGVYEFKWTPKEGYGAYPDDTTEMALNGKTTIKVMPSLIKPRTNILRAKEGEKVGSIVSSAKIEY